MGTSNRIRRRPTGPLAPGNSSWDSLNSFGNFAVGQFWYGVCSLEPNERRPDRVTLSYCERTSQPSVTPRSQSWKSAVPKTTGSKMNTTGAVNILVMILLLVLFIGGGAWLTLLRPSERSGSEGVEKTTELKSVNRPLPFPVTIRKPAGPPCVDTGLLDASGQPVTVACSTCHTTREPNFKNRLATDLDEFHGGLTFNHGELSCLACHNATDYNALKLADGTRVEYTNVMTLCGQCHGPQMRDYKHGAHGGMNGYWDLTRGGRTRNNCIDCHDPHAPQFPSMVPTFKPRDRFLDHTTTGDTSHE